MDKPSPSLDCPSCGYSLTGITRPTCPECGQAIAIISEQELKRKRRWVRPYFLGICSATVLYLLFYLFLRVPGVYPPSYSQGSWEVKLDSNSATVDAIFLPLAVIETAFQFHFSWFYAEPFSC